MKTLIALGKVAALFSSPLLLGLYVYDRSGGNVAAWFSPATPPSDAVTPGRRTEGVAVVSTEPLCGSTPKESTPQSVTLLSRPQSGASPSDAIYVVKRSTTSAEFDVTVGVSPVMLSNAPGLPLQIEPKSMAMFSTSKSAAILVGESDTPLTKALRKGLLEFETTTFGRLFNRDAVPPLPSTTAGR